MTGTGTRLASFALVLAGAFATAYVVGERLPGHSHVDGGTGVAGHTHGASSGRTGAADAVGQGLSSTVGDHRLVLTSEPAPSGRPSGTLAFHIERQGEVVTSFSATHGAMLHLLLVRRDLAGFQHLHPTMSSDGTWSTPVELASPGAWRLVVDVDPADSGEPISLGTDVLIAGEQPVEPVPAPQDHVVLDDGLQVHRTALTFVVSPADGLEPYLGEPAHLVAFRSGDLTYTHLHPSASADGAFVFDGAIPRGTWRLFFQFGRSGDVVTVPFTVEVV
jgi:hypothetical protein